MPACSSSFIAARRGQPVAGYGALSSGLRDAHPEVPWSDIARMRDLIGHHYYKLDPQIVRATIGDPVARLRAACEAILAGSSGPEDETDNLLGNPANTERRRGSIERLESDGQSNPEPPD
jgi:Protein of unknown function DUF86